MRAVIWKFKLPLQELFELKLPKGAQILCVQSQNNEPHLWAQVEPSRAKESRTFRMQVTGEPFPTDGLHYLGTFQTNGGNFVGHVYETFKEKVQ